MHFWRVVQLLREYHVHEWIGKCSIVFSKVEHHWPANCGFEWAHIWDPNMFIECIKASTSVGTLLSQRYRKWLDLQLWYQFVLPCCCCCCCFFKPISCWNFWCRDSRGLDRLPLCISLFFWHSLEQHKCLMICNKLFLFWINFLWNICCV